MHPVVRRSIAPVSAVLAAALLLTACGSSSNDDASSAGAGSTGAGSFPVTIDSALGPTTIKEPPKRVVTLGWGSDDATLALGIKPVGMSINSQESPDGITPWAKAALGSTKPTMLTATSDSIPYEKIAALKPDVILAVYSGVTDEQFATLSKIAPTVGYPDKPWATTWEDQISTVGKALGRSDDAAKLKGTIDAQLSAAAKEHPEFTGKTAIFGSGTKPGSYNFYLPDDPRMQLLGSLGFTVSDAATSTFSRGADSPSFATTVSLEQLPSLNVDVLVAWYLSDATRTDIEQQPVFKDLSPVKDEAYVPITDPELVFATSAPNVLSIPWMLKSYVPLLATAAKNAG